MILELKELLMGIDIGLFIYFLFLYIKVKKVKIQEKINNTLIDTFLNDNMKNKVIDVKAQLVQRLGKKYKPLSEVLRQELKYLSLFLVIYNIVVVIIMYVLS